MLYVDFFYQASIFSRRHFEIFFLFSQETGLDISCKLSPMETICMKCQLLFSGKKIRKVSSVCCLLKLTRERWASIFSRRHFEYFSYFSKETGIWHFMQIVSNRDSLHEMPNSVGWKKYEKYHRICLLKLPTEW